MTRIPPNLVYLAIYNPSLRSTSPPSDDDDEAEEQAHILFYTSKERAVSRDRMLRQIGLARALANFAEMFSAEGPLDNVHSQTRRMIMMSPEPDFWIHACIELAKVPRVAQNKGKGKGKDKGKEKGKEKEGDVREGPVYDHEDGSVQDGVLREDIMRGYERFKLTHGTFTSILHALGQEALALQLERFWTPWAWSWALSDGHDFGEYLGVALHSYFKTLSPILDDLQTDIPSDALIPLLLSSSSIVPSTTFLRNNYPRSLPLYLMSLIPPPRDPSNHEDEILGSSQITIRGTGKPTEKDRDASGGFLGMPNMNMDVRKWNWTGVLTFGRVSAKTSPGSTSAPSSSPRSSTDRKEGVDGNATVEGERDTLSVEEGPGDDADKKSIVEGQVNQTALDDAISSRVSPSSPTRDDDSTSGMDGDSPSSVPSAPLPSETQRIPDMVEGPPPSPPSEATSEEEAEQKKSEELHVMTPKAPPMFMKRTVHLQGKEGPLTTCQRRVYFLLKGSWMLALISGEAERGESELQTYLDSVAARSEKIFEEVEEVVQAEMQKSTSDSLPSAARILQPMDIHIASTGTYTLGGKNFQSKSGLLYEARALQERDPEISEIFSRGQNPQHWHVARRTHVSPGTKEPAEVYMEVFRKETSLADVDNVLAGAVKSWKGIVDEVEML